MYIGLLPHLYGLDHLVDYILFIFMHNFIIKIYHGNAVMKLLILTITALLISGCSTVQPWEKDTLAKPEMTWDPQPLESAYLGHVYFSKEASSGSLSAAGGGCGCN